ncbi:DUF5946 family protein [Rubrobacter aplysinae]|uniref:DUF5946 family protein n=1 Tax=Rubrobacter aplysinae TaxID=909625 RepID=UPI00069E9B83|nr:DUF5946 family protein [Rubrobacter aplysinae]
MTGTNEWFGGSWMGGEPEACYGCGALVPRSEKGTTHEYIGASPGCWSVYGKVLEREYADYERYFDIHRLTVDAYAAQHPGEPSRRATQSVAVHLIRLHLMLELGLPPERANAGMQRVSSKGGFVWLEPPESPGWITVLHVREARDPAEHEARVREWAGSVWEAWSGHHEAIRRWAAVAFRAWGI